MRSEEKRERKGRGRKQLIIAETLQASIYIGNEKTRTPMIHNFTVCIILVKLMHLESYIFVPFSSIYKKEKKNQYKHIIYSVPHSRTTKLLTS